MSILKIPPVAQYRTELSLFSMSFARTFYCHQLLFQHILSLSKHIHECVLGILLKKYLLTFSVKRRKINYQEKKLDDLPDEQWILHNGNFWCSCIISLRIRLLFHDSFTLFFHFGIFFYSLFSANFLSSFFAVLTLIPFLIFSICYNISSILF